MFVIFNENHSFDNEFGTFPGVDGLYSDGRRLRPPQATPGFTQTYTDRGGRTITVQPFRIGPDVNSNVVDSVDHSHVGLAQKIDVVDGRPRMDGFARREYSRFATPGATPAQLAKGTQYARLVMSHVDCDTMPFFWKWASNFTIFDRIFATEDSPSTPNAIAMIAGQAGETQWVRHPGPSADPGATGASAPMNGTFIQGGSSITYTGQTGTPQGPPLVNDPQPWYGSQFDATPTLSASGIASFPRQPYGPNDYYRGANIAANLTFASLPLTLMGRSVAATLALNRNPDFDLPDIRRDIAYIQRLARPPVDWRWYQAGYGLESSDSGTASHAAYVSHHQGPQYFGYLANTPGLTENLKGETDFFTDLATGALPHGGVFYIRGGYQNQMGLTPYTTPATPAAEKAAIEASKAGDDDHPGYSDRQLSEAMAARVINAVAGNPQLWAHSAIIITYDESDGFYDHVPPRILSYGPDGLPLARGIRVPLILISPYARTHAVSHAEGDHNAVIETINAIFDLPPLASLPEEKQALKDGDSAAFNRFGPPGFRQKCPGPARHPLADQRQPAVGLRSAAPARRQAAAAGLVRDDRRVGRHDAAALRRPGLQGAEHHAGGAAIGQRCPGRVQPAAEHLPGGQLRPVLRPMRTSLRIGRAAFDRAGSAGRRGRRRAGAIGARAHPRARQPALRQRRAARPGAARGQRPLARPAGRRLPRDRRGGARFGRPHRIPRLRVAGRLRPRAQADRRRLLPQRPRDRRRSGSPACWCRARRSSSPATR